MTGNILVENISKSFGNIDVLKQINLNIEPGSFTILLGPSGCGKSTLLRIISGLETPTSGNIIIDGETITDYDPKDRKLAMVFQNYALYPHMTTYKNIEYGLRVLGMPKDERKEKVTEALKQVDLLDQADKLPAQMSGGQRQRVALARAIVKRPKAFLMDEPLSNLDAKLRNQMRFELIDMYKKLNTTFVYVTHDQVEAMSMGTHIILMNKGVIMQQGSPREIYESPQSVYVAQFIGSPPANIFDLGHCYVGIRPEDVHFVNEPSEQFCIPAEVHSAEQLGGETIYHVKTVLGTVNLRTSCTWSMDRREGFIEFPQESIHCFDKNGKRTYDRPAVFRSLTAYIRNSYDIKTYDKDVVLAD